MEIDFFGEHAERARRLCNRRYGIRKERGLERRDSSQRRPRRWQNLLIAAEDGGGSFELWDPKGGRIRA